MIHNKVEIYSNAGCPYCEMAISLAKEYSNNLKIYRYDLGEFTKEELLNRIPVKLERLKVPQIFVNEKYVGGYDIFYDFVNCES